jgi:hypothetical protein
MFFNDSASLRRPQAGAPGPAGNPQLPAGWPISAGPVGRGPGRPHRPHCPVGGGLAHPAQLGYGGAA